MLSKDKLVNKYLDIKVGNLTKGNNIVFCSDLKYSRYVGVAIFSILENNQDDYYCFHVFITDITPKDIDKLKQLPFQNCNIRLYWLNDDAVRDFQIKEYFSSAMYYRVLIPYILYDEIDNFLYLDSDVLCVGNIKELFFHNLSDKVVGVVPDTVESDHIKNLYDLGFTKEG
ncbi:glycosyltransferase family 8 protein, partial [Rodentibacter caecimuris]|uniref:glycosyltransferase family 8 protein n=1 Tax=Rodentibacter caecimuris TaxID=1796644 RepID=UPI00259011AB